jgi:hypothetical protein
LPDRWQAPAQHGQGDGQLPPRVEINASNNTKAGLGKPAFRKVNR